MATLVNPQESSPWFLEAELSTLNSHAGDLRLMSAAPVFVLLVLVWSHVA